MTAIQSSASIMFSYTNKQTTITTTTTGYHRRDCRRRRRRRPLMYADTDPLMLPTPIL